MSGRTLRRRLTEHGLTFEALLERVRQARTLNLLGNPELSIERITEEVGYSDVRSFRRAFKRWTGLSPSAFATKRRCIERGWRFCGRCVPVRNLRQRLHESGVAAVEPWRGCVKGRRPFSNRKIQVILRVAHGLRRR